MKTKNIMAKRYEDLTFVDQIKTLLSRFGGTIRAERINLLTINEPELIERLSSFIISSDSSFSIIKEHSLSNSALQPDLVLKKDNTTAIIDLISSLTAEAIPGRFSYVAELMIKGGFDEGIIYVIQNPNGSLREAQWTADFNGKKLFVHYHGLMGNLKKSTAQILGIGRNDRCPCGSGMKFKKCCLQDKTNSAKRVLLQGPSQIDLTDLLYYDALVYEFSGADNIPPKSYKKLVEADLIYALSGLNINSIDWNTINQYVMHNFHRINAISTNESEPDISGPRNGWIQLWAESISQFLKPLGLQAIPKYSCSSDFFTRYSEGRDEVLSIIYSELPQIDIDKKNINHLLDFLKDDETQKLKRRLLCWKDEIETSIENNAIKLEHVADLLMTRLEDYSSWMKKSELKLKYEKRELIYYSLASIIVPVSLPKTIEKVFKFKKRQIELRDDEKVLGRELAYIAHSHRKFASK